MMLCALFSAEMLMFLPSRKLQRNFVSVRRFLFEFSRESGWLCVVLRVRVGGICADYTSIFGRLSE